MKESLTDAHILLAYELAGIGEITAETPLDRMEKTPEPVAPSPESIPTSPLARVETLEELRAAVLAFDGCYLKKTATNTVFGAGNPRARVMLVGEAPGAEEDKQGLPFVGKSGMLLDKMLASIGLSRAENCYISNILPWRPPGNRTPSSSEVATCLPFIKRHIAIVNPDFLVFLGAQSLNALLEGTYAITKVRGQWFDYPIAETGRIVPALATFHPAFLLRSPGQKKGAWADLLALRNRLTEGESS